MKSCIVSLVIFFAAVNCFAQGRTTKDIPKNRNYKTLTEQINGEWKLDRILDSEKKSNSGSSSSANSGSGSSEANDNQSSNGMQLIEFTDESRYRLNNASAAVDSGSYVVNETTKTLVLQSDTDANELSEWTIAFNKEQLTLTPKDESTKHYRYYYRRTKSKAGK